MSFLGLHGMKDSLEFDHGGVSYLPWRIAVIIFYGKFTMYIRVFLFIRIKDEDSFDTY